MKAARAEVQALETQIEQADGDNGIHDPADLPVVYIQTAAGLRLAHQAEELTNHDRQPSDMLAPSQGESLHDDGSRTAAFF